MRSLQVLGAAVVLLGAAEMAFATEPSNFSGSLEQPRDTQNRHWTAKRFFTQHELQNIARYRLVDLSRADYLEYGNAGSAGDAAAAADAATGAASASPGTAF